MGFRSGTNQSSPFTFLWNDGILEYWNDGFGIAGYWVFIGLISNMIHEISQSWIERISIEGLKS